MRKACAHSPARARVRLKHAAAAAAAATTAAAADDDDDDDDDEQKKARNENLHDLVYCYCMPSFSLLLLAKKLHNACMSIICRQRHSSLTRIRSVFEMLKDLEAFVS